MSTRYPLKSANTSVDGRCNYDRPGRRITRRHNALMGWAAKQPGAAGRPLSEKELQPIYDRTQVIYVPRFDAENSVTTYKAVVRTPDKKVPAPAPFRRSAYDGCTSRDDSSVAKWMEE